jgi:hypothetical protein
MKGGLTVEQLRLRAIAQKEKAKIQQRNGTAPKPKKHEREQPKPKTQPRKRTARFSATVQSAFAAVAVALGSVPAASAQGLTSAPAPSRVFSDRAVLFWPLVGALTLWVAYVLVCVTGRIVRRCRHVRDGHIHT